VAARADRVAVIAGILRELTDADRVVMTEECEHHRYAVRDLSVLEARV
jgi:hypothetical protein